MTYEPLSDVELRIVRSLRDISPGRARDELMLLVEDLIDFASDPRCPRAQGDGVPCLAIGTACEECRCVAETFARLHEGVRLPR